MKRNSCRIISLVSIAAMLAIGLVGCASSTVHQLESGERTAGAAGEIEITKDANGNQLVTVDVGHLPHPSDLAEDKSVYTVWLQPADSNQRYNMGQIRIDDDRAGNLAFTTPFDRFILKVTAEAQHNEERPSDHVVLRHGPSE